MAIDIMVDATATAQTVHHITDIAMVVGTTATIMCMDANLAVTVAAAVWIKEVTDYDDKSGRILRRISQREKAAQIMTAIRGLKKEIVISKIRWSIPIMVNSR